MRGQGSEEARKAVEAVVTKRRGVWHKKLAS